MPSAHFFLDWKKAFIPQLSRLLFDEIADAQHSLEDVCVVLPGARAGRSLLTNLVMESEKSSQKSSQLDLFIPPQIITPAAIFEVIYGLNSTEYASEIERLLAWQAVLQENVDLTSQILNLNTLSRFGLEYAKQIDTFYQEVHRSGQSITQARQILETKLDFPDSNRWHAIEQLSELYRQKLTRVDSATAELQTLEIKPIFKGRLILAGIVEFTPAIKSALKRIEDQIQVVTFAPQTHADYFDDLGCVDIKHWNSCPIDLQSSRISVCSNDHSLVAQIAKDTQELIRETDRSNVTIGLCNIKLEAQLVRALARSNLQLHVSSGVALRSHGIVMLCQCLSDFYEQQSAENLARLIRLPEVEIILKTTGLIEEIDLIRYNSLALSAEQVIERLQDSSAIRKFLTEFIEIDKSDLELTSIAAILQKFIDLGNIYEDEIRSLLDAIIEDLAVTNVDLKRSEWLHFIAQQLSKMRLPQQQSSNSIEGLGWLELLLDDASSTLLAGFHEDAIPGSVVSDAWLPESARAVLGLTITSDRVARDAYILSAINARCSLAQVYISLTSSEGDTPLASQLLMRCQADELPARVIHLAQVNNESTAVLKRKQAIIEPPMPPRAPSKLEKISISALAAYQRDPYSFALQYLAKLEFVDDQVLEMDSAQFGSIAHEIIAQVSLMLKRAELSAHDLDQALDQALKQKVLKRLAQPHHVAAAVQIEFLSKRMKRFAQWQRQQIEDGWCVLDVECPISSPELVIEHAFGRTVLSGRIDRIDYNSREDRYLILDFKTGNARSERRIVNRAGAIIDLQLPLYAAWFNQKYPQYNVAVAFLQLNTEITKLKHVEYSFEAEQYLAAKKSAAEIIELIHHGAFESKIIPIVNSPFGFLYPQQIEDFDDQAELSDE